MVVGLLRGPLVAERLLLLGLLVGRELLGLLVGRELLGLLVGRVLLGLLLLGMVGLHLLGLHLLGLHLLGHLGERYQYLPVGEALGRWHWGRIVDGPFSDIPHTEAESGCLEFPELVCRYLTAHGAEEEGPGIPRVHGFMTYKPGQLKQTHKFMSLLGKISELKWHVKEVAPIFSTMTVYLPRFSLPVCHRPAASGTP